MTGRLLYICCLIMQQMQSSLLVFLYHDFFAAGQSFCIFIPSLFLYVLFSVPSLLVLKYYRKCFTLSTWENCDIMIKLLITPQAYIYICTYFTIFVQKILYELCKKGLHKNRNPDQQAELQIKRIDRRCIEKIVDIHGQGCCMYEQK